MMRIPSRDLRSCSSQAFNLVRKGSLAGLLMGISSKLFTLMFSSYLQELLTIHDLLFTFHLRWRPEITVGDKTRSRRIIFLRFTAGPYLFLCFPGSLDVVELSRIRFALRRDCDLSLQIRAIEFRVHGFQAIQHDLRRMSVAIPRAVRNDRGFRLRALYEVFRRCILRSVVRDLDHVCF